jgi:serine/threonine protein kinase
MSLAAGTRFGPYEVIAPLGSGGMGEVYRARDTRLDRDAALKILPLEVRFDASRAARFEREARILATLSHANIATLFGLEESGGTQALAMELVEGQPLSDHLSRPDRKGHLPLAEALALARQIAVALDAAHDHGIIHRDLKPANLMVRPDGTVKVLDFGLATHVRSSEPGERRDPSTLTGAGAVVGTPAYMSPEQARGYPIDRRTDIWSFGCVLFELLSGRRAFDGPTASDVMVAVLEHDPDWSQLPPSTPASLRRLLTRCLAKDPRHRLRDIGDVLLELDDIHDEEEARTARAASRQSMIRWRAAALASVAVLAGLAAWSPWRTSTPHAATPSQRFALSFPDQAPLTPMGGIEVGQVAISPDGSRIVYPTPRGLAVRTRDQLDITFIDLPGEGANSPFFSPDGGWIGYSAASSTLRKVPARGGASIFVADTGSAAIGAWGARGIVYTDQQGMFYIPNGSDRPVTVPLDLTEYAQPTMPEVLPGGRVALVTVVATRSNTAVRSVPDASSRIDAIDLVTGARTTIVRGGGHARYLRTGHLAYGAGRSLWAVGFDPDSLEVQGTPVEVVNDPGAEYFEAASDGTLIYVRGLTSGSAATLVWVDRQGREEPLGTPSMSYLYPRLSPDERRIALDVAGPNRDIYIWDIARRALERFTTDPAEDAIMRWSPDGSKLVFANSRFGMPNIFWQASDGSGAPERVFENSALNQPAGFTREGALIVAEVAPGRARGLKVLSLDPPRRTRPLLDNANNAELSPDGRWLAYGSTRSGQFEVYVTSYPDAQGRWQVSRAGGRQPAWSHDGKELFYRDFSGALITVPVTLTPSFSAGPGRKLFEDAAYHGAGSSLSDRTYDVTRDGRRFVMIRLVDVPRPTLAVVQNWFEELESRVPLN